MTRTNILASFALGGCLAVAGVSPARAHTDVNVGVSIGIPLPPAIIVEPPRLVVVPTTPAVQYAPDLSANVLFYGGRYYAWNEGSWFVTGSPGAPWAVVEPVRVPHPVLVVPARYYRVPPGQAKKYYHGGGHKHGHGHGHDDDD